MVLFEKKFIKNNWNNLIKTLIILALIVIFGQGCVIIKKIAGADIDPEQFQKAREAKMAEIRLKAAASLAKRLSSSEPIDNGNFLVYFNSEFLNKIAIQYKDSQGWLDPETSYIIKSVKLTLYNGSAIVSLSLLANNNKYNVDVDLTLDCIATISSNDKELTLNLEPFNISPDVKAGGLLSSAEEMIGNLIKINLANLSKNFPPLKIPVNFTNQLIVPANKTKIKDKLNMIIENPKNIINYKLKIKEILIFSEAALISLNLESVEVK